MNNKTAVVITLVTVIHIDLRVSRHAERSDLISDISLAAFSSVRPTDSYARLAERSNIVCSSSGVILKSLIISYRMLLIHRGTLC